jgi:hypothetical protein
VRDDLPPGGLRFINASSRTLAMIFGTQRIALASGKDWTTRLMPGQVVGLQLGVPDGDGGFRRILSRSLEQGADQRTLVVLSEADRSDARGPGLKITPLTEQVRKQLPTEAPPE